MAETDQQPRPSLKLDPVPIFTESDSFVVIKSAQELENMSFDSEIADMSLLLEHKMLLHEELAQLESVKPSLINSVDEATMQNVPEAENEEKLPSMPPEMVPKEQEAAAVSIISFAPSDFGSEEIQAKVNQVIEENTNLKVTILQNNQAMQLQCDRIVSWKEDNERIHDNNKRKFQSAKVCIEMMKKEIDALKTENAKLQTIFSEMEEKLSIKKYGDQYCANLQEELDAKQKKISQLENELREIRNAQNMEAKIELLKSKKLQQSTDSSELFLLRQQLMQSQMGLTESEQKNADSYIFINKLQTEINQLREQLDRQQTNNDDDDLFALRTQLDIYKADFEAERAAREEMKRDKDKIAEDLQHLHRRNQQLQEEIELVSRRGGRRAQEFRAETQRFECPKCAFKFSTEQALLNHIERCIDIDGTLP